MKERAAAAPVSEKWIRLAALESAARAVSDGQGNIFEVFGVELEVGVEVVCGPEWKGRRNVGEVVLKLLVNGANDGGVGAVAIERAGESANGLVGARCCNTTKPTSICGGENHAEKHDTDKGGEDDEARATLEEPTRYTCDGKERNEPPDTNDALDRARK